MTERELVSTSENSSSMIALPWDVSDDSGMYLVMS